MPSSGPTAGDTLVTVASSNPIIAPSAAAGVLKYFCRFGVLRGQGFKYETDKQVRSLVCSRGWPRK